MGDNEEAQKKEPEKAPQPEGKAKEEQAAPGADTIVLIIQQNLKTHQLNVRGPGDGRFYDEPVCFWMLEKAKDFIKIFNEKQRQSAIIQPRFGGIRNRIFGRRGRR